MKIILVLFSILLIPSSVVAVTIGEVSPSFGVINFISNYQVARGIVPGVRIGSRIKEKASLEIGFDQLNTTKVNSDQKVTVSIYHTGYRYYPGWKKNKEFFVQTGLGLGHFRFFEDNNFNKLFLYYGVGFEVAPPKGGLLNVLDPPIFRIELSSVLFQDVINRFRKVGSYNQNTFFLKVIFVYPVSSRESQLFSSNDNNKKEMSFQYVPAFQIDKKEKIDKDSLQLNIDNMYAMSLFTWPFKKDGDKDSKEKSSPDKNSPQKESLKKETVEKKSIKKESSLKIGKNKREILVGFDYCPDSPEGVAVDGKGCPVDTDFDTVYDTFDECPKTLSGVSVDKRGCMFDDDKDEVPNGLDKCPFTQPGINVNHNGCFKDSDNDSVADSMDFCPNTPPGMKVDGSGCERDPDGDGVFSMYDRCPNTPAGVIVDTSGCASDLDGDGIVSTKDLCHNTPVGVLVDVTGCPADSDGDGVLSSVDRCPDTRKGIAVDVSGCSADLDGDGVLRPVDRCLNTRKGVKVDRHGCEIFKKKGEVITLKGVNFDFDKYNIKSSGKLILKNVAEVLVSNPAMTVEISGHTDSKGSRNYNYQLSKKRAKEVLNYLVQNGVKRKKLNFTGFGSDNPKSSNATAIGRAENRRVELKRIN